MKWLCDPKATPTFLSHTHTYMYILILVLRSLSAILAEHCEKYLILISSTHIIYVFVGVNFGMTDVKSFAIISMLGNISKSNSLGRKGKMEVTQSKNSFFK